MRSESGHIEFHNERTKEKYAGNPFNKNAKDKERKALMDRYIPGVEVMRTRLKKYDKGYRELSAENKEKDIR